MKLSDLSAIRKFAVSEMQGMFFSAINRKSVQQLFPVYSYNNIPWRSKEFDQTV